MYCITNSLKCFFINFLINKLKTELFIISNLGCNPENFNYEKKPKLYNYKFYNIQNMVKKMKKIILK